MMTITDRDYDILIKIYDLGVAAEQANNLLLQYHNSLQDGLRKDWLADMMDYMCGWRTPEKYVCGKDD